MAGDVVIHGDADAHALSQMQKFKFSSNDPPLDSSFASATSYSFLAPRTMVSFGGVGGVKRSGSSFFVSHEQEDISDEYLDEYLNQQEKKRRLSVEQVQFLEKKFETENKLDPERKIQLAKELDLKPRQIAIWFQNRRARWKTKQLETDYETLHANYQSLKTNFTNILKENEKLKAEVLHLKHSGSSEKVKKANFEFCDNEEQSYEAMPTQATGYMISESVECEMLAVAFKNDERTSAKSNVTDADSPCLTDGIHSSLLDSGEPSHVFELNHSDLSRNREDNLDDEFAKIDEAYVLMPSSSCNHGFPVEDQAFSFWSY